jgi:hypothetical protein
VEVDNILRDLADDPAEYLRQGGQVLMTRQGKEHAFTLHDSPGVGIVVQDPEKGDAQQNMPLLRYIQQELLELPRLAAQIVRAIDRASAARPTKYIEGSAEVTIANTTNQWTETSSSFRRFLSEQELGTTRLVQLMAGAGQGKTVLLEQLARETAITYQPDPYPAPFLLTVDLLGRYVGTVDDAIAGSLNNTYMFPGLTQRDVALCVRNRWLILALDGFDELVARVGARDAFLRITELLEQLRSSGTVILSARESFFQLYQISAAIRSYLQPRQGSYSTAAIRLLPWTEEQGKRAFASLGSTSPESDLRDLLHAFGDDTLVLQPFFLTRLASLWVRGERFADAAAKTDPRWRTQYIIETFIDRESSTKWTDRDRRPLLPREGHTVLLSGIAEEMWRSGAFRLSEEELRIAAEIALAGADIPPLVLEAVAERVATHAALITKDRGFTFLHDRFFDYYLSTRLSEALVSNSESSCRAILGARDLSPDVILWIDWLFSRDEERRSVALLHTLAFSRSQGTDKIFESNVAQLLGVLLSDQETPHVIRGLSFSGEALCGRHYTAQRFEQCNYWQLDISGTHANKCTFYQCEFGDVLLNEETRLQGTVFSDCTMRSIEMPGDRVYFDPATIRRELERLGAQVEATEEFAAQDKFATRVSAEATEAVAKLIRKTQQSYDISLDEIEHVFDAARMLVRIGIESGILREVNKNTSGPKKEFVRFTVDRQMLLRGQAERTGEPRIDAFWDAMAARFPARKK